MQLWKRNYQKAWSMCRVVVLIIKPKCFFSRSHSCYGHQILRCLLSLLNLIILKPCHRVSLKEGGWLLGLCRWLFETKLKVICLDFHLNVSACYLKLLTVSSSSNTASKSIKALPMSVLSHLETQTSEWNFCRWVADVPPRETYLSGDERGETSAVRRLIKRNITL